MTTDRPDLDALRALAKAALIPPGDERWYRWGELAAVLERADTTLTPDEDARLIAACSPDRILALIAEVEEARKR